MVDLPGYLDLGTLTFESGFVRSHLFMKDRPEWEKAIPFILFGCLAAAIAVDIWFFADTTRIIIESGGLHIQ